MKYFLPVVFLITQCTYALDVLPAPVNVRMVSVNFRHELNWDPGPGTPPGATYKVFARERTDMNRSTSKDSKMTSCVLKLDNHITYSLSVKAVYNHSLGLESKVLKFQPSKNTEIGRPVLSLVGGDQRLELNISLPKAHQDAKIPDIQKLYDSTFTIKWKRAGYGEVSSRSTRKSSEVLDNLQVGTEYCVQVDMIYRTNDNNKSNQPSDWVCAWTSGPEPSKFPTVIGIFVAVLVLFVGVVVVLSVVLHYTGLCGIKARLPAVLMSFVLARVYLLTPEMTISECVCLHPEVVKQKGRNTQLQAAVEGTELEDDEDEYEEDADEGEDVYMNRAAELLDSDSSDAPGDSSGNSSAGAHPTVDRVMLVVELPLPRSHGQPEVRGHSVKGSVMLDADPHGIFRSAVSQGEWDEEGMSGDGRWKEGEEEEGDVNLFSVTLGKEENSGNINLCSMIFGEIKETADNEPDVEYAPHDREPHRTLSSPASQSGTPSDTPVVLLPPILDAGQSHGGETGYITRRGSEGVGTSCGYTISHGGEMDNEEEQEQEDFSGYLGR